MLPTRTSVVLFDDSEIKRENGLLLSSRARGNFTQPRISQIIFGDLLFAEEVRGSGCWSWGLARCGDLKGRAGADLEVGPALRWGDEGRQRWPPWINTAAGRAPPLRSNRTDLLVFRLEIKRHLVQIIRRNYFRFHHRARTELDRVRIISLVQEAHLFLFL